MDNEAFSFTDTVREIYIANNDAVSKIDGESTCCARDSRDVGLEGASSSGSGGSVDKEGVGCCDETDIVASTHNPCSGSTSNTSSGVGCGSVAIRSFGDSLDCRCVDWISTPHKVTVAAYSALSDSFVPLPVESSSAMNINLLINSLKGM